MMRKREDAESAGRPALLQPRNDFFTARDGTRLYYRVQGTGAGTPLVFCYGLVCSESHWKYQLEFFSKTHPVIWMDYRGHHRSEMPRDQSTLNVQAMSEDLNDLLDHLEIQNCVILGHSMGVNVALEAAHARPDRVAGLVLANGTARRPFEKLLHTNLFHDLLKPLIRLHQAAPGIVKPFWKNHLDNGFTRLTLGMFGFNRTLALADDIAEYSKRISELDPATFFTVVSNYKHADASPWLHEIDAPVLLIGGERDHITPIEEQELLAQLLPNAELERVRAGSHCTPLDLPELVNFRIERFIRNF